MKKAIPLFGLLLLMALSLSFPPSAQSQENRCLEIHEECTKAKLPVLTVRMIEKGRYEVILKPTATALQKTEATNVLARVLATKLPSPCKVATVEDALVVLRFEPDNADAKALIKKRYEEIKAKSQGSK